MIFKKVLILSGILLAVTAATEVQAQSACGYGAIEPNNDCDNSRREWNLVCCPDGEWMKGVAYTDISGQDHVDAISAMCRSPYRSGGAITENRDISQRPKEYLCETEEVLVGLYHKDVRVEGGGDRDTLDGLTAVCQNKTTGKTRQVFNQDIEGGRTGRETRAANGTVVVGVAYKETDKGSSDRADCVTLITAPLASFEQANPVQKTKKTAMQDTK